MKKRLVITILLGFACSIFAQAQQQKSPARQFFDKIKAHSGLAYQGKVTAGAGDDDFSKNVLEMHVKSCEENRIRIPFNVGENRSRTWVLVLENDRILLKHDHRHQDGTEDKVTQYGGWTPNAGSAEIQIFPADNFTAINLPHAVNNIWWITINETEFTYNLRRIGTDRLFSVTFDLTKPVKTPLAPWGWKD